MNKMRVFLLFAVLVGVISACQSKSEQTAGQEQDTMDDSLAVAPTEDEKTNFERRYSVRQYDGSGAE